MAEARRLSAGAELSGSGTSFRVWAPKRKNVSVVLEGDKTVPLACDADGFFTGFADGARAGTRYQLRLDDLEKLYPDPASRFQPEGPHEASEIIDPDAFTWTDQGWAGTPSLKGQVVYELHIGTFTKEGTYRGGDERARRAERSRRHAPRDHAARGVPRALRLGLRRRRSLRADAPLRTSGRPPCVRRSLSCARSRRDFGCGLQPSRTERQLPHRLLRPLLHREIFERVGRRHRLRDGAERARVLRRERWVLGRRIPLRRPPPRRDAEHPRRVGETRHHGAHRNSAVSIEEADRGRRRERAPASEARSRDGCRRTLERRLPPLRARRPHGTRRGVLLEHEGHPRRSSSPR